MLDNLTANAKTLAVAIGASIVVGVVVYALGAASDSALRGTISELKSEIEAVRASQASTDQRLSDGDAQAKATALRLDEVAARLDDLAKTLTPPQPAAMIPPTEAAPEAHPAPEGQSAPLDLTKPTH